MSTHHNGRKGPNYAFLGAFVDMSTLSSDLGLKLQMAVHEQKLVSLKRYEGFIPCSLTGYYRQLCEQDD